MLKLKFIACAIIFCWLSVSSTFAQVPPITESQARAELDKLGMSEDDFRVKLLERGIDIDILFYNDEIIEASDLCIPHKYISKRKFVLDPLNEIAPNFIHPKYDKSIAQLLEECLDEESVTIYEV